MSRIFLATSVISCLLLVGCGADNGEKKVDTEMKAGPISFASSMEVPFLVNVQDMEVANLFNADALKSAAQECETEFEDGYYEGMVENLQSAKAQRYVFKHEQDSTGSGQYLVTLVENKTGYESLDKFKKDFGVCAAGSEMHPTLISANWLLFVSSCGVGAGENNKPNGCAQVEEVVAPSLKLN